ncbi:hypothetical protein [Dyella acidiphila]|uniref:Uncharacterized protein n=1 Tax=Dyella acidiphila TaxID=2775866 RepID=A0ABR9GFE2_9GAMM|nr:hypothetical protein [Dyella acidiphila]MBE1162765.1 hypothetical protein [Dyella acidiphila]
MALLALTLLVNTHSALIKQICAIAILLAMATASVIVLWRIWKHRGQATPPRLGQLSALPPKWQKWVLGEVDDSNKNDRP